MRLPSYSLHIYSQLLADSRHKMILTEDQRRNRDRCMPSAAFKNYKYSPFEFLYNSLNDQALSNATGHNHRTFNILIKNSRPIIRIILLIRVLMLFARKSATLMVDLYVEREICRPLAVWVLY